MQDLLDLQGASGATYRFRLIAGDNRLPATSGNFVYVSWRGETFEVFCCGAVSSLSAAADRWDEAVRAYGPAGLYVRLNVASALRDQEHADLVAHYHPSMAAQIDA